MSRALFGLGSLVFSLAANTPSSAVSFSLTPDQIRDAVRVGEENVAAQEYGREWQVVNGAGESLTVLTPFERLAAVARSATFRGERLGAGEIETLLRRYEGRLLLRVDLRGDRADFARWYRPVLVAPELGEVAASFVQNERTARQLEDGSYLARCLYVFPSGGLPRAGRVTLRVRDRGGQDVSQFTVDLARMR